MNLLLKSNCLTLRRGEGPESALSAAARGGGGGGGDNKKVHFNKFATVQMMA